MLCIIKGLFDSEEESETFAGGQLVVSRETNTRSLKRTQKAATTKKGLSERTVPFIPYFIFAFLFKGVQFNFRSRYESSKQLAVSRRIMRLHFKGESKRGQRRTCVGGEDNSQRKKVVECR